MARVIITSPADADTACILTYLTANAGHRTAVRYNTLSERLYDRLADFPASGAPRPALGRSIGIAIVSPFIVIYRHSEPDDTVAVLRLVHGRRRITGKLLSAGA